MFEKSDREEIHTSADQGRNGSMQARDERLQDQLRG